MRARRLAALLLIGGAAGASAARGASAQLAASVDAGVSRVSYDGFLPSSAWSVTPSLRLDRAWASLSARGTAMAFESGNRSLQGAVATSLYAPLGRGWRGELAGTLGGSRYADVARFWHALARGRLHHFSRGRGAWLGSSAGRTSYGLDSRAVLSAEGGAWTRLGAVSLSASVTGSRVGDTTWADLEGFARWSGRGLDVDATVGTRTLSDGAGAGTFGEITASIPLNARIALMAGGGRYPTDPVRGSISGRYVTAALRVRLAGDAPVPSARIVRATADPTALENGEARLFFRLEPVAGTRRSYEVVIAAPGAATVDVMGDFTDWEPVPLRRAADGSWRSLHELAPGVHRVNIRVDGGEWVAPAGTTPVPDDFGGTVGVFVLG